jgi:hypothetical protein
MTDENDAAAIRRLNDIRDVVKEIRDCAAAASAAKR